MYEDEDKQASKQKEKLVFGYFHFHLKGERFKIIFFWFCDRLDFSWGLPSSLFMKILPLHITLCHCSPLLKIMKHEKPHMNIFHKKDPPPTSNQSPTDQPTHHTSHIFLTLKKIFQHQR